MNTPIYPCLGSEERTAGRKRAMESGSEQRSPRLLPFEAKSQLASPP